MKNRRFVDLLLILTGGAIALVSYFYLEGDIRWWLVALGCAMILIFLILAVRERHWHPLQAGAPILDMPPAAKVTEVQLLNEEGQTLATWPLYGKVSMGVVRTTYVIDENGMIEKVFEKAKPDTNAADVLAWLDGESQP